MLLTPPQFNSAIPLWCPKWKDKNDYEHLLINTISICLIMIFHNTWKCTSIINSINQWNMIAKHDNMKTDIKKNLLLAKWTESSKCRQVQYDSFKVEQRALLPCPRDVSTKLSKFMLLLFDDFGSSRTTIILWISYNPHIKRHNHSTFLRTCINNFHVWFFNITVRLSIYILTSKNLF